MKSAMMILVIAMSVLMRAHGGVNNFTNSITLVAPATNPASPIRLDQTNLLAGLFYPLKSNPSNYVNKSVTNGLLPITSTYTASVGGVIMSTTGLVDNAGTVNFYDWSSGATGGVYYLNRQFLVHDATAPPDFTLLSSINLNSFLLGYAVTNANLGAFTNDKGFVTNHQSSVVLTNFSFDAWSMRKISNDLVLTSGTVTQHFYGQTGF